MKCNPGPELDAKVYAALTGVSFGPREVPEYSRSGGLAVRALEKWLAAGDGRCAEITWRESRTTVILLGVTRDPGRVIEQAPTFAHAVSLALAVTVKE